MLIFKGTRVSLKIDHLTFLVKSLEKSTPYYNHLFELIGFIKVREHVWSDNKGLFIQFGQAKEGTRSYERYGAGLNHIGFSAPSEKFVENVQQKMAKAGFNVPEIQDFEGVKSLFMKDFDGIRFVVSYYPTGASVIDE